MKSLVLILIFLSIPFTFNCDFGREKVIGNFSQPDWEWAKERMKYHGTLVAEYHSGEWYFVRNGETHKLW